MRKESWKDRLAKFIADCLPRRVVYFTGIRIWVKATIGQHSDKVAPAVTISEGLKDWSLKETT